MNRIFSIPKPFRVPDGTLVSPFLNAKDSENNLPFDLLDGFSLAAGIIDSNSSSKIHIAPLVSQVTFVRSGNLAVKMKGPSDSVPYILRVAADQAVFTKSGTYLQFINESPQPCEVLYIVSPAYVFDKTPNGEVLYDDSLVLDESWDDLEAVGWRVNRQMPTSAHREEAMCRLGGKKSEREESSDA